MKNRRSLTLIGIFLVAAMIAGNAMAASVGHYAPGVWNIRDWGALPPGLYFQESDVWYHSTDLRGANGNSVGSINIGGQPISISPNVNVFTFAPALIWSTGKKFLGADYTMLASPTFGKTGVGARLNVLDTNRDFGKEQLGVGDLFVQPVRLSWHGAKYDFSPAYGFWAPMGTYTTGAPDNVGLGFWSHQVSGTLYYYPKPDQSTAFMVTSIYEFNTSKSGVNFKPGNQWGIEYGLSQYLTKKLEVGVAGYNVMQVSHDSGQDATSATILNHTNGIGPQATYWVIPNRLNFAFRMLWDYHVQARFDGTTANLSLTYVIRPPKK